jgi:methionyl-tRNA formyltransferase
MKSKSEKKIAFFGSSHFSSIILESLSEEFNIQFVVIKNIKSDISTVSNKLSLRTILFDTLDPENIKEVDFCIVASFGAIIGRNFLNSNKFLNVHPSLLPKFRGATPIQSAIISGSKKTGVSIIKMNEKMDEGDILSQISIDMGDNINYLELEEKLANSSIKPLTYSINNFESIIPVKQDSSKATYCYISDFAREKIKINWNSNSDYIDRLVRSAYPAWCYFGESIVNIKSVSLTNRKSDKVGYIDSLNKDLLISSKDFFVKIEEIQKEGGRYITGREFKNGLSNSAILKFD